MEIHLQEMRKRAGLKQAEIAKRLDVKVLTYGPWERGGAMMSLEQAYNCAVFLDCSIDEIAGMPVLGPSEFRDPRDAELQDRFLDTARDFAGMSQDVAERDLPTAEGAR